MRALGLAYVIRRNSCGYVSRETLHSPTPMPRGRLMFTRTTTPNSVHKNMIPDEMGIPSPAALAYRGGAMGQGEVRITRVLRTSAKAHMSLSCVRGH
jgi:hypothetical protein